MVVELFCRISVGSSVQMLNFSSSLSCIHVILHITARVVYRMDKIKQASSGLWGSSGLKMPIHAHFFAGDFDP